MFKERHIKRNEGLTMRNTKKIKNVRGIAKQEVCVCVYERRKKFKYEED